MLKALPFLEPRTDLNSTESTLTNGETLDPCNIFQFGTETRAESVSPISIPVPHFDWSYSLNRFVGFGLGTQCFTWPKPLGSNQSQHRPTIFCNICSTGIFAHLGQIRSAAN